MNLEQYLQRRQELMAQAETQLNSGDTTAATATMNEVTDLDSQFNEIQDAQANLNALQGPPAVNLQNQTVNIPTGGNVIASGTVEVTNELPTYETAWAHAMMGETLTDSEQQVFMENNPQLTNEFTHTTANTAVLIPETVVAGIFKRAEENYPLFGDGRKFAVMGDLTFKKHEGIVAGDAKWYDEDTATEDEENKFGELKLSGKELSKAVTVSWKLKKMAVPDFINFITRELSDRVGVALGTAAFTGDGDLEPKGVVTTLKAETETPQVLTYTGEITYQNLTSMMALLHSSYASTAVYYANSKTIWNKLANILDGQGRPIFIPDPTAGGVGRIFGSVVKADAGAPDNGVLLGSPAEGQVWNTNEPFSVTVETHAKQRKDDYVAYAIVDGGVLDTQAFAWLEPAATPPEGA